MTKTDRRLAVIIPYYQRDSGILRRALDSIFAQDLPSGLNAHIFIIDDSSPLPATGEIVDLPQSGRISLSLHSQPNAGPGAARNTGLELVQAYGGFDFVAFLDSDDEWTSSHLAEAVDALDRGYDFYFCDNARPGDFESHSDRELPLSKQGAAIRDRAEWQSDDGLVLGFPANVLNSEILEHYLCQTSAVVFGPKVAAIMRFDTDLRSAGEDHLFWIKVFFSGCKIAVSWRRNTYTGLGVNIYYGSFDWNKIQTLDRVANLMMFRNKLAALESLTGSNRKVVSRALSKYRRAYAFLISRAILKRQPFRSEAFRNVLRIDPVFPMKIPFLAISQMLDRHPESSNF